MALTALQVKNAKEGFHGDGGGLYLCVSPKGKSWIFRFKSPVTGKRREMGIGSASVFTLQEARDKALDLAKQAKAGVDPIDHRDAQQAAQQAAAEVVKVKAVTFADAATGYIDGREAGWKNEKHVGQWRATLDTYCPFKAKLVGEVTLDDAEAALRPIWLTKSETATRVLTRIVAVMAYAHDKGWSDDDGATWATRLRRRLPQMPSKTLRVQHHPALPYDQATAFMADLRGKASVGAKCLEFVILTAARSGEARLATWSEIDFENAAWTIPASRMKMKREHRVPLSAQAIELLLSIKPESVKPTNLVFPGMKEGKPVSDMTLNACIRRKNEQENRWVDAKGETVVPHGFRSMFRDWAAETTPFPSDVVEMALAHAVGNKVEAAYRRGDLFDRRCLLMQVWADFNESRPDNVVVLKVA